jgi:hypothetical protein
MKRLLLVAFLALLATPGLALAQDQNVDQQGDHQDVKAREVAGVGVGIAALLGVAGYLVLRRRRAA